MKAVFAIFLGGGVGSLVRFFLGKWVNGLHSFTFPLGTFIVNLVACLLMGFIIGLAEHKQWLSPTSRLFWTVGVCGGFSTFSAFSSESLTLLQQGQNPSLILYVLGSVLLCLTATFLGIFLAERM